MSHLPANFGAEILAGLPEARRLSVVRRIATMGRTNPEIIREVEKGPRAADVERDEPELRERRRRRGGGRDAQRFRSGDGADAAR